MRNSFFSPRHVYLKSFSFKAKVCSLWSVGYVVEEMLIMWLSAGLVCCDLEGFSLGTMWFYKTRSDLRNRTKIKKKKSYLTTEIFPFSWFSAGFSVSQNSDIQHGIASIFQNMPQFTVLIDILNQKMDLFKFDSI